jgi:hypothetical protein
MTDHSISHLGYFVSIPSVDSRFIIYVTQLMNRTESSGPIFNLQIVDLGSRESGYRISGSRVDGNVAAANAANSTLRNPQSGIRKPESRALLLLSCPCFFTVAVAVVLLHVVWRQPDFQSHRCCFQEPNFRRDPSQRT